MSEADSVFNFEQSENILIVTPAHGLMRFRDLDIRDAYNDTYRRLCQDDITHLLFDFAELDYFSSTFVGILIRLAKKARLDGGEAVLCNLNDNMRDMMKTLMLLENTKTDFFWVPFASRQEAINSLQNVSESSA